MKTVIIIPARFDSSRFPGKPLTDILGLPMIIRTCLQCSKVVDKEKIYVATDSKKIQDTCKQYKFKSILIKDKCLTGTDRVALASKKIKAKYIINLQGDEPIFNPKDIKKFLKKINFKSNKVYLGATKIISKSDFKNKNIPKLVINENKELMYASRQQIPSSNKVHGNFYRQVLIYGFSRNLLKKFYDKKKTPLEDLEDIEILRFLEKGLIVKIIKLSNKSISVDTLKDIEKVKRKIR